MYVCFVELSLLIRLKSLCFISVISLFLFFSSDCTFIMKVNPNTTNLLLKSPGYPEPVPPNTDCMWLFPQTMDRSLYFKIEELVLQPKENCSRASFRLGDRDENKVCASQSQPLSFIRYYSSGLYFKVGPDVIGAKFKSYVTALKCKIVRFFCLVIYINYKLINRWLLKH